MASLEDIRKKLLEQQERQEKGASKSSGDNQIYQFWNIPDGTTATLRFLPDSDDTNTFFWRERLVCKLPFQGIKGQDEEKETIVQVPCMEMFGKTCPILSEIRPWFKDPELDPLARKYWKKRSYLFQGFVVNDPMGEEKKPENPIRRFVINPTIFDIIKESLMDADMEELPTDYEQGRDFKLKKTRNGQYANYSTSSWSTRARPLSNDERTAIDTYGLFDLKGFLPNEPDEDGVEVIKEMFKASVEGEPYDPDRFGEYFRPFGMQAPEKSTSSTTKPKTDNKSQPQAESSEATGSSNGASDALSNLKSRVNETKEEESAPKQEEDKDPEPAQAAASSESKPDPKEVLKRIQERTKNKSA